MATITDLIDELINATAIINGVANGAVDQIIPSDQGDLITMATANRDIQAAIDAIELKRDQGISDINADVAQVDTATTQALIDIQNDVDSVDSLSLQLAANVQPIGSVVKNISEVPQNSSLKLNGSVIDKYDYPEYSALALNYRPDQINAKKRTGSTPLPFNSDVYDVIYANGRFVAVGDSNGTSFSAVSKDGINWDYHETGIANFPFRAHCFNFGGDLSPIYAYHTGFGGRSYDGKFWDSVAAPNYAYGLSYSVDDNLYVAVGVSGYIGTASPGGSWTTRTPSGGSTDNFYASVWGNGVFIIAGNTGEIQTSPDGITWTAKTADESYSGEFRSGAYKNGIFVIVGESGEIQISRDSGNTWKHVEPDNSYTGNFRRVIATNNGFIIIGNPLSGAAIEVQFSTDGEIWKKITVNNPESSAIGPLTIQPSLAVDIENPENIVICHDDYFYKTEGYFDSPVKRIGDIESSVVGSVNYSFLGIDYGNSIYVAVGENGYIYSSPDGSAWTQRTPDASFTGIFYKVIYAFDLFVAVGASGEIQTSPDGITWTHRATGSGSTEDIVDIEFGNSVLVAVTSAGNIQKSTNGTAWTEVVVSGSSVFYGIAFGNNFFIATGADLFISSDGSSWDKGASAGSGVGFDNIVYGNKYFLMTNTVRQVFKTKDGYLTEQTYSEGTPKKSTLWEDIIYAAGLFICVGSEALSDPPSNSNEILISSDAETWEDIYDLTVPNSIPGGSYSGGLSSGKYLNNQLFLIGAGAIKKASIEQYNNSNLLYASKIIERTGSYSEVMHGICFGLDTFVMVGGDTTARIQTSPDGTTWTSRSAGGVQPLKSVVWGYNLFVAVGTGNILRSGDGITWVTGTVPPTSDFKDITYTKKISDFDGYIAVGTGGRIATSGSAATFTAQTPDASFTGDFYVAVYGKYIAIIAGASGEIQTSPDGITWTHRANDGSFAGIFRAGIYAEGLFILAGDSGELQVSKDGIVWKSIDTPFTTTLNSGFFYKGIYFLVGNNGFIQYSYDGYNWLSKQTEITNPLLGGVAYDNKVCIVGGTTGTQEIITAGIISDTGENSTESEYFSDMFDYSNSLITDNYSAAFSSNDLIVIAGGNGQISVSTDGEIWNTTENDGGYTGIFYSGVYGNGIYVLGGFNNVQTSTNGKRWTAGTPASGFTSGFHGLAFGNGLFVAVGDTGEIETSTDGVTWIRRTADASYSNFFVGAAYGNGVYVIVGYSGEIQTSPDGITWTHRVNDGSFANNFHDIAFLNGVFVAIGDFGEIQISTDGITWESIPDIPSTTNNFKMIGTTKTAFIIGGASGEIRKSYDGRLWSKIYQEGFTGVYSAATSLNNSLVCVGASGKINKANINYSPEFNNNYQVMVPYSEKENGFNNYTRVI